jgi:hypothetical protein
MNSIVQPRPNMNKTLCFMLSGKAGVGKSYCAKLLNTLLIGRGLKSDIFNFAYGVKQTALFMGWDKNKDDRGRKLLQGIGNIGRTYDEDTWVRSTFIRIEDQVGYPFDAVIIDDWRFNNELSFVSKFEPLYKPIRIRVEAANRESLRYSAQWYDVSETELDLNEFDYTLLNSADGQYELTLWLNELLDFEIDANTRK